METIGYQYQLTLRTFLDYGLMYAPKQIIKYRDELQFTYLEHYERVKRLSNALAYLGVKPGEAVGMLEWDTHRYLEAHWAIPLYGSLFHTVNIRMAPEQIAFCINHAEDVVLFVNEDFLPLIESIQDQLTTVRAYVLMSVKYILPGRYEPDKILRWLHEEKVNFSHCVTTILHMLVFHPDVEKYDLSNWHVGLGGAKLNRQLAERAWELGILTQSCYGMTETCPAMTLGQLRAEHLDLPMEDKISYYIKSGIPWIFSRVKVVDDDFNELPHDGRSVGNVVVRTPWCTHEYFREPEKTRELWKNDWLNTGDVGYIDPEGYLMITDRNKDAIKSGGEWISTLILEDAISQFKPVLECAVIGIPHPRWDERPCACIDLKPGETATAEDVKAHLEKFAEEGKIEKWWIPDIPDGYFFVEAIPHNYIGKIEKNVLRQMYAEKDK